MSAGHQGRESHHIPNCVSRPKLVNLHDYCFDLIRVLQLHVKHTCSNSAACYLAQVLHRDIHASALSVLHNTGNLELVVQNRHRISTAAAAAAINVERTAH